ISAPRLESSCHMTQRQRTAAVGESRIVEHRLVTFLGGFENLLQRTGIEDALCCSLENRAESLFAPQTCQQSRVMSQGKIGDLFCPARTSALRRFPGGFPVRQCQRITTLVAVMQGEIVPASESSSGDRSHHHPRSQGRSDNQDHFQQRTPLYGHLQGG